MGTNARIYVRRNGFLGSSCNGVDDTGHHITVRGKRGVSLYTVYDMDDPDKTLAVDVSKAEAERVIAEDWERPR